jgi:hypothetical protein
MTTEHKFAKQSQFPTRLSRAGVGGTGWSAQRGRLQGARRPVTSCGRRRSLDADGWKTYLTSDDPPRTATYLSEGGRPSGRLTLARPGWESRTESTTGGKNRSGARAGFGETDGRRPARAFHDEGFKSSRTWSVRHGVVPRRQPGERLPGRLEVGVVHVERERPREPGLEPDATSGGFLPRVPGMVRTDRRMRRLLCLLLGHRPGPLERVTVIKLRRCARCGRTI